MNKTGIADSSAFMDSVAILTCENFLVNVTCVLLPLHTPYMLCYGPVSRWNDDDDDDDDDGRAVWGLNACMHSFLSWNCTYIHHMTRLANYMATHVKLDERKGSLRTGVFDLHKKWLIEFSFDHLFCMPKGLSDPFDGMYFLEVALLDQLSNASSLF